MERHVQTLIGIGTTIVTIAALIVMVALAAAGRPLQRGSKRFLPPLIISTILGIGILIYAIETY